MKKQYLFLTLLGILMVHVGVSQQKTITGIVTDENGLPLPGATVIVENTTKRCLYRLRWKLQYRSIRKRSTHY